MNDIVAGVIRWTLRLVVVAAGVVFFLSLLAAAAVLALVWGVRALWARLTGRPVMPWAMRMSPRRAGAPCTAAPRAGPPRAPPHAPGKAAPT